jgi:hypothetical protein
LILNRIVLRGWGGFGEKLNFHRLIMKINRIEAIGLPALDGTNARHNDT